MKAIERVLNGLVGDGDEEIALWDVNRAAFLREEEAAFDGASLEDRAGRAPGFGVVLTDGIGVVVVEIVSDFPADAAHEDGIGRVDVGDEVDDGGAVGAVRGDDGFGEGFHVRSRGWWVRGL